MSVVTVQAAGQESLDKAEKLLAGIPGGVDKAFESAMNRAVSHLRTNSAKVIRERYDITAGKVKANHNFFVKYDYRKGALKVEMRFSGGKFRLVDFGGFSFHGVRYEDTSRWVHVLINGRWKTVHPNVSARGHQLKMTLPRQFGHAFAAQVGGHTGMFEEEGGQLKEVMGSSVPQMLGNEDVSEKLGQEAMEKFEERLEHEILARLNGWV